MEETKSIQFRHPELEESFSFSSSCHRDFSFSSSLLLFSDNEGIGVEDDDDDEESYIEIALEPKHSTHQNKDDEIELRISFSSSIQTKSTELYESPPSSMSSSSSTFTFSSSFAESQWNPEAESKQPRDCRLQEKTIKSKVQFPVLNRFVNTFVSSFRLSSEIDLGDGDGDVCSTDASHLELVPGSKRTKQTTTTINSSGMMMNFLVKFRALKLKTLLASFLKASQANSGRYNNRKKPEESFRMTNWNVAKPIHNRGSAATERKQENGERSRMLELNLEAIKGHVLDATNITSTGRKDRRIIKSCPVSSKASPIHQQFLSESYKMSAADSSIQAAIAYCKRSFGPNV